MGELRISIEAGSLERIDGDLAVLGLCADDCGAPLRGAASRADWRACGLISACIADGGFTGKQGESLLVPAAGGITARRVLVVGLGDREGYGAKRCCEASERALAQALALGARVVVFATPGVAPDDFARHARAVVDAAHQALAAHEADTVLTLRIPVQQSERGRSESALAELSELGRVTLLGVSAPADRPDSRARGESAPAGSRPTPSRR